MIPNALNTILGIALVYCAILAPNVVSNSSRALPLAGLAIVAFALWARASDKLKWFSAVNGALGIALMLLGILALAMPIHPLVTFWWIFWVGIIVAVLAFWSALYNYAPAPDEEQVREAR
ncbi:MAG TPA: hypothetical protein VFJ70_05215 [Burkholderiales bacterium]|nr:hypothetical protein [Burkholderiales bacterium]